MNCDEEQRNELEALEAIFAENYILISEGDEIPRKFELIITPNATPLDNENHDTDNNIDDSTKNHVALKLCVTFPNEYPTIEPEFQMIGIRGLTNQHISMLTSIAKSNFTSNIGTVSVYNVSEALKEWLLDHNQPQLSMYEQMEQRRNESDKLANATAESERMAIEEAQKSNKTKEPSPLGIEPGTIVTKESFLEWKRLFDEEQKKLKEIANAGKANTENKLTGKQLFQQNLAKELLDSEADQLVEEKSDQAKVFWFANEGLFADDDLDIDEELNKARQEELDLARLDEKSDDHNINDQDSEDNIVQEIVKKQIEKQQIQEEEKKNKAEKARIEAQEKKNAEKEAAAEAAKNKGKKPKGLGNAGKTKDRAKK